MALWMALTALFAAIANRLYERLYEAVIERGLSFAQSELSLVQDVEAEIEKLSRTVTHIQTILTDADERRYIEDVSVHNWLRRLKNVAFDADDLIDEFQTHLNASRLKRKRPWYYFSLPSLTADPILLKRRRIAGKIVEIRDSLDSIHNDRKDVRLRDGDARRRIPAGGHPPPHQAGALQDVQQVRGRVSEVNRIVESLMLDGGSDAPVIPLVGMGGLGKTTLAGLIFEDGRVVHHFQQRIWVCVSKDLDPTETTRLIIEAITKGKCDTLSLDSLQHLLASLVGGKKYLLVLDNACHEDASFWETVRRPLLQGAPGSKVLITTRSEKVTNVMSKGPPIALQGLETDDCWSLFRERAFKEGQGEQQNLVEIGKKIVERCQGSPLAAKSLGGLLYSVTDEGEWRSVLEEMWAHEESENHILSTLKVSYDHLPLRLKRCFQYCSIFPNGYKFDKDELVKLWMAEGFIEIRGRRRLEAIGGRYFDDLLWRSFFQNSDSNDQSKQKYKMPSLVHDLAQSVSIYECLRMEHNVRRSESWNPRYASIFHQNMDQEVLNGLCIYKSLRTLFWHSKCQMPLKKALCNLFVKLTCLRTLDLRNSQVEELPNSIGDLKHLRYLGLYNTQIKNLPESVCSLYNLQTLELGECYSLLELPNGMGNLVNLRHLGLHLDWDRQTDLRSMPPGISRLTSLQTLSRFTVTSGSGCGIGELKALNLRGELCISKLEDVDGARDAKEANLKDKLSIEVLMLRWSRDIPSNARGGDGEKVMAELQPHTNLKNLWIENYNGIDFPSWIGDPSFTRLESLKLSHCKRCKILPHLGKLPRLTKLCIERMHVLESLANLKEGLHDLISLESLEISSCPELASLPGWLHLLASLRRLEIQAVPKLSSMPVEGLPNGLQNLSIRECPLLQQRCNEDGGDDWPKIRHIPYRDIDP